MKLKGSLPKGEANGLGAVHSASAKKPETKHLVIGVIDAATVSAYPSQEVQFEVLRIEAVPPHLQEYIAELLEQTTEERTGQTRLDIGIDDDLDMRKHFAAAKQKRSRRKDQPEQAAIEAARDDEDIVDAEVVDDADIDEAEDTGAPDDHAEPTDDDVMGGLSEFGPGDDTDEGPAAALDDSDPLADPDRDADAK